METWKGDFNLQTGQTAEIDAVLKVGASATEVTVAGDVTPLVTTTAPTLANVVERARIEQLPFSGRIFQVLVEQTTPGVEGPAAAPRCGACAGRIEFMQDGAVLANRETGEIMRAPAGDGHRSGVPRRDQQLLGQDEPARQRDRQHPRGHQPVPRRRCSRPRKNNGFGVARKREDYYTKPPHLVRNEFGASGGGPLYLPKIYNGRNKTFFFVAYEAYRSISVSHHQHEHADHGHAAGRFQRPDRQRRGGAPRSTIRGPPAPTWSRQPYPE